MSFFGVELSYTPWVFLWVEFKYKTQLNSWVPSLSEKVYSKKHGGDHHVSNIRTIFETIKHDIKSDFEVDPQPVVQEFCPTKTIFDALGYSLQKHFSS